MKELAYNLRFLKKVFLGGPWLKLSAVYCFFGFIIVSAGREAYIDIPMKKSICTYAMVISVLPAAILLYYPVVRICQNSSAVLSAGKENYICRVRNLLWLISSAFVLYYCAGTYLMSKFIFSEGHWNNMDENLKVWGMKAALLLLFLLAVSIFYCFSMARNLNPAAAAFMILAAAWFFWSRIDVNGLRILDFTILCALLLVMLLAQEYLLKRWDFMYWR